MTTDANNPGKSTKDLQEDHPVVKVVTSSNSVIVKLKWNHHGEEETMEAPTAAVYSDKPYSFSAFKVNGKEPQIPTFGSLPSCHGGILTIRGVRYRIEAPQEFPIQEPPDFLTRLRLISFDRTHLTTQFLKQHELQSYLDGAVACVNQDDVVTILEFFQNEPVPRGNEERAVKFTAIVAPSGTGKTQLATTAALKFSGKVRYLLCDDKDDEFVQLFYQPHVPLARLLKLALRDFEKLANENAVNGGNAYRRWFENEGGACPLATLLDMILFADSKQPDAKISFNSLLGKVKSLREPLLVFLDEFPSIENPEQGLFLKLRDVLRALGISPIVMSTHTGAQNAVGQGSGSSNDDSDPQWCRLVTRLPRFHTSKSTSEMPYLCPMERPLVASYLSEMNAETSLDKIIESVQLKLQQKKPSAWTENPAFQLCQLFRSSVDLSATHVTTYRLVGKHFGHIVDPLNYSHPTHELTRSQAKRLKFRVQMVVPSEEPMLFTALTSWNMSSLDPESSKLFPLVNGEGIAISVRRAYEMNSELFDANIPSANPTALKLNGEVLEITSLASVCLASMNSDRGVGQGTMLPQFFACVFHFMQKTNALQADQLVSTAKAIQVELENYAATRKFVEMVMPCCSSADSPYSVQWRKIQGDAFQGSLKRPRDRERRDGCVTKHIGDKILEVLHIECKNYADGVPKEEFSKVVNRLRPNCTISVLFASSLQNFFAESESWGKFIEDELLVDPHEVAFLQLAVDGTTSWLTVENGNLSLAPTDKTTILVVVVETGPI